MADTQASSAPTGSNPPEAIDREKLCPFLLRMYYNRGQHHRIEAFSPTSTPPQSSELRLYTWKNATLGEITSLVKQAIPDMMIQAGPGELSFRHIYLDIKKGVYVGRDVGSVQLDNPLPLPLQGSTLVLGGDIPKEGLFTKDIHHSGSSIATAVLTTGTGAGGIGEATAAAAATSGPGPGPGGNGGGPKAYEKTLGSIRFVIGDYLDIAITSTAVVGVPPLPLQRRQHNTGGRAMRHHHHGGHRSGRQGGGGGLGVKPLGDRLAGRLGFGHNGHKHGQGHGHGQGMGGRRGQSALDVQNEPSWKGRGRGR